MKADLFCCAWILIVGYQANCSGLAYKFPVKYFSYSFGETEDLKFGNLINWDQTFVLHLFTLTVILMFYKHQVCLFVCFLNSLVTFYGTLVNFIFSEGAFKVTSLCQIIYTHKHTTTENSVLSEICYT